ncbi:hypothetical protein C8F01DRAFT_1122825 [Mycena amicta]|nr:hypothetical protein C8F01DRAFT_1122825 [Mycena amicta]
MTVAFLREQRAQLEERIVQAEILLESLKTQRDLVEEELSKVVYPVLLLPPELTTKIFASAVATGVARHDPVLLRLAAVCQQWRATAMGTSALWQCIAFHTDVRDPEQLFICFAERSGHLPLHFSIRVQGAIWEIPRGILHYSTRWKTAHFLSGRYAALNLRIPYGSASLALPLLEELTMDLQRYGQSMVFRDTPSLRKLCSSEPVLVLSAGFIVDQLQSLELHRCSTEMQLLELLYHTSNLETLVLPLQRQWAPIVSTGPPLPTYHKLHTLSCVPDLFIAVIDRLTAPALHTLHLPDMGAADSAALLAFLARSGCTVRTLSLGHEIATGAVMEYESLSMLMRSSALASVSQVTFAAQAARLISSEEASSSDFVSLLGDGTFLPGLNSLALIVPSIVGEIIEPYVLAVINRAEVVDEYVSTHAGGTSLVSRIGEFTLSFSVTEIYDSDMQNLEYLSAELGVRVNIPNGLPSAKKWSMEAQAKSS